MENLLLDSEGVIKLCDFGSATTQQLNPDPSWTAVQRGLAEDEVSIAQTTLAIHQEHVHVIGPLSVEMVPVSMVIFAIDLCVLTCKAQRLMLNVDP